MEVRELKRNRFPEATGAVSRGVSQMNGIETESRFYRAQFPVSAS
jgi:hypothetical protein